MWEMLHERNAIEAMALTIKFAEPLSSVVGKRVLGDLEGSASKLGMIDKQPIQGLRVEIGQGGGTLQQLPSSGMNFQRKSLERQTAVVGQVVSAQATFNNDLLQYQTFRYQGWRKEFADMWSLLEKPLRRAVDAVTIGTLRLEYLDRFIFVGAPQAISVGPLLKPGDLLAGQIFSAPDMWHSHTGRFDDVADGARTLKQINADLQELVPPHPRAGSRTLALMTAIERQFHLPGLEVEATMLEQMFAEELEELHEEACTLFFELLNDRFADEHGLNK
jgi:uncharacterized protein (TIGR04255 family)